MKIGIFDSGLGGLFIAKALIEKLPQYDYLYLGDTQRVPYGNRSRETVYTFLREAAEYLFDHGCELIIVACNTASAEALRQIQQEYLPKHYPRRRILGMIIPTAEAARENGRAKRIGILATQGTVHSQAYVRELKKIDPHIRIFQHAAPLLVPIVESNSISFVDPILRSYLKPLIGKNIDTLILGCTHYPILKTQIRNLCGHGIKVISQDEIISQKLADYLARHPEIERKITKKRRRSFCVTDFTETTNVLAKKWFGKNTVLRKVDIG